jgi:hypothetical protein
MIERQDQIQQRDGQKADDRETGPETAGKQYKT